MCVNIIDECTGEAVEEAAKGCIREVSDFIAGEIADLSCEPRLGFRFWFSVSVPVPVPTPVPVPAFGFDSPIAVKVWGEQG